MLLEKQFDQKFVPFLNDKNKTTLHESGLSFKSFQLNVTVHKVEETQEQILLIRPVNFQIMNTSYKLASVGCGCVRGNPKDLANVPTTAPVCFPLPVGMFWDELCGQTRNIRAC